MTADVPAPETPETVDVDRLRALLADVTKDYPGKWGVEHEVYTCASKSKGWHRPGCECPAAKWSLTVPDDYLGEAHEPATAHLIVAAVNALPSLLNEVERLRAAASRPERHKTVTIAASNFPTGTTIEVYSDGSIAASGPGQPRIARGVGQGGGE